MAQDISIPEKAVAYKSRTSGRTFAYFLPLLEFLHCPCIWVSCTIVAWKADAPCSVGATLLIIGGTTRRQTNHGWSRTLAAMASMWSDIEQLILLQWNLDGESTLQHDSWCDATVYNRGPVLCFRMSSTNNGFRSSVLWIRLLC